MLTSVFVATVLALVTSTTGVQAFPDHSFTLTAYKPGHEYDGAKINWGGGLNLFQEKVASYCPDSVQQQGLCPNGTDTVFAGALYPLSTVPGGQDTFVYGDGLVSITVQHSHSLPAGGYWAYQGFNWTPLDAGTAPCSRCPEDNSLYNCDVPTGIVNFQLPNVTVSGLAACPNPYRNDTLSVYAVTPAFNRTGCTELDGLGTHNYTGVSPPVWAY